MLGYTGVALIPVPIIFYFLNAGAFWVFFILIEWAIFQGASS